MGTNNSEEQVTIQELQEEFEHEMIKTYPGLFLDTMPNGEYSHPDVYTKWMLYKTLGVFFLGVTEE